MSAIAQLNSSIDDIPVLQFGSRGETVKSLQEFLRNIGQYPWRIDGYFSRDTEASVRVFQGKIGIPSNGMVEARTWRAISRLRHILGH